MLSTFSRESGAASVAAAAAGGSAGTVPHSRPTSVFAPLFAELSAICWSCFHRPKLALDLFSTCLPEAGEEKGGSGARDRVALRNASSSSQSSPGEGSAVPGGLKGGRRPLGQIASLDCPNGTGPASGSSSSNQIRLGKERALWIKTQGDASALYRLYQLIWGQFFPHRVLRLMSARQRLTAPCDRRAIVGNSRGGADPAGGAGLDRLVGG